MNLLVIAFEGLISFDSSGTKTAYKYSFDLLNGVTTRSPSPPLFGGWVLHGLIVPMITKHASQFEFLVFPHDSINDTGPSVAEICAKSWLIDSTGATIPNRRLEIVGHSNGGHAAIQLANALSANSHGIYSVITLDPDAKGSITGKATWHRTPGVTTWENFIETNTPLEFGNQVIGADKNLDLTDKCANHFNLPAATEVVAAFESHL